MLILLKFILQVLFRTEPEKKSVELDFDASVVKVVIQHLIKSMRQDWTVLHNKIEDTFALLEVTDFLGMEDLYNSILAEMKYCSKINMETIYAIAKFSEKLKQGPADNSGTVQMIILCSQSIIK